MHAEFPHGLGVLAQSLNGRSHKIEIWAHARPSTQDTAASVLFRNITDDPVPPLRLQLVCGQRSGQHGGLFDPHCSLFMSTGCDDPKYLSFDPFKAAIRQYAVAPDPFERVAKDSILSLLTRVAGINHQRSFPAEKSYRSLSIIRTFGKSIRRIGREYVVHSAFHHCGRRAPAVGMDHGKQIASLQQHGSIRADRLSHGPGPH